MASALGLGTGRPGGAGGHQGQLRRLSGPEPTAVVGGRQRRSGTLKGREVGVSGLQPPAPEPLPAPRALRPPHRNPRPAPRARLLTGPRGAVAAQVHGGCCAHGDAAAGRDGGRGRALYTRAAPGLAATGGRCGPVDAQVRGRPPCPAPTPCPRAAAPGGASRSTPGLDPGKGRAW